MARLALGSPVVVMVVVMAMTALCHVLGQIHMHRLTARVAPDVLGHHDLSRASGLGDGRRRVLATDATGLVSLRGVELVSMGQGHRWGKYRAPGHGNGGPEGGRPSPGQSADQAGALGTELPVPA
jgi:hypothetical protein